MPVNMEQDQRGRVKPYCRLQLSVTLHRHIGKHTPRHTIEMDRYVLISEIAKRPLSIAIAVSAVFVLRSHCNHSPS